MTELSLWLEKSNITDFKTEICKKKYAFGLQNVPRETEYIKLNYSYKDDRFSKNFSGLTFSHMFGTSVGPLENFLITKNIMGPCWLRLEKLNVSFLLEKVKRRK